MTDEIKTIYAAMLTREPINTTRKIQDYVSETVNRYHEVLSADFDSTKNIQNLLEAIISECNG